MTAAISIKRRVQWMDTDAAGIWHHSTVTRWVEEAEAELHRRLGIIGDTFGVTPRVNIEYSFHQPLVFDEEVEISLDVAAIGDSSVTYAISVHKDGTTVVTGRMTAVLIERETRKKRSWPDHLRSALESG